MLQLSEVHYSSAVRLPQQVKTKNLGTEQPCQLSKQALPLGKWFKKKKRLLIQYVCNQREKLNFL